MRMEGNGQFAIRRENDKVPVRLQFHQMGSGGPVSVEASLEDGTTQTLCLFKDGKLTVCDLSVLIAEKLGIELANGTSHIKVCTSADSDY